MHGEETVWAGMERGLLAREYHGRKSVGGGGVAPHETFLPSFVFSLVLQRANFEG